MATNDGATTELYTGWSSVVHQPEDEPEESELPSTVDIRALNSGPPDLSQTTQNIPESDSESEDSESDSSNSERSSESEEDSCSHSDDSSDSDSSSSSQESSSRSPSPEFSVKSSQTNGLRLTIATVRKTTSSPADTTKKISSEVSLKGKRCLRDNGKDDRSAGCGGGVSGSPEKGCGSKTGDGKVVRKKTLVKKKNKKMASLPLSRSSNYTSSDSDSSDGLLPSACSLQEIRQEDLAAILPDQSECNDFNDFDKNDKDSPTTGDISGSDMELPQQAINNLIQRTTESSSDGEGHQLPNPQTLFANSILQQFVPNNNHLLVPSTTQSPSNNSINDNGLKTFSANNNNNNNNKTTSSYQCGSTSSNINKENLNDSETKSDNNDDLLKKKGRGRPKREIKSRKIERSVQDCCGRPNVSPDSGIPNSPDHASSPEPCSPINVRSKSSQNKEELKKKTKVPEKKSQQTKISSSKSISRRNTTEKNRAAGTTRPSSTTAPSKRYDRVLYTSSDRILYPPRRRLGRPNTAAVTTTATSTSTTNTVGKRLGRPPKHNNSKLVETNDKQSVAKSSQMVTARNRTRIAKVNNNSTSKDQDQILKTKTVIPKILHSKHKEKHKKRKIKIPKPRGLCDPKINQQIDQLVTDFTNRCVITVKPPKEVVLDQIFKPVKKVTKKRRTTDHFEKKKKKQSVNSTVNKVNNSNEQRLPIKKRHYYLLSNSSENQKIEIDESKKDTIEKPKINVEEYINELKVKRNLLGQKNNNLNGEDKKTIKELTKTEIKKEGLVTLQVEKNVQITPECTKKKVRKRRVFNRTGFPSTKRKKKKVIPNTSTVPATDGNNENTNLPPVCDRVPKEGEEINTFLERSNSNNNISECESLPQDERIDFDVDDSSRSDSIIENVVESRKRQKLDSNEMSLLEFSITKLRSRLGERHTRSSSRALRNVQENNNNRKRKIRDDSPASSIEPSCESRLRDSTSASSDELSKRNKKFLRIKKKYLVAGLFSNYYKEDEATRQDNSKLARSLSYNTEEHPHGLLPPPIHCGKYLRTRKSNFQLPYDLWWQHTHSQLPGRDTVPSWNYKKIRTNFYNVKSNGRACEPQSCNCKPASNCGDDCINRLVLAECPATHKCKNQRIQKHDWAPGIEKFMTENKGWGVRTKESIKQGEFILEYIGEVVSDHEFKERMNSIYVNDTHHYCLHLDGGLVIDGHRMGGEGRFVNHSCEPNCEMQKWSVNGQFRMALFALRNIEPDEELTYDYNFSLFNLAEGQECKCRSENCRGVIGGKTQRIRQVPELPTNNNKSNTGRFRKVRDRSQSLSSGPPSRQQTATRTSAFMSKLSALQNTRNMKTRRVAQVEDNPELNKTVKLATILNDILTTVTTAKDENKQILSTNLMQLPSKRKTPEFYQRVKDPIDLSMIQQNITTRVYKTPESFDEDMNKLFSGFSKFYDRTTDIGISITKLKKIYATSKQQSLSKFENVLGEKPPPKFANNRKKNEEEEDIIRCICGIPRNEGLMIQCERCMVWQHIECVKADASQPSYHCEICVPRDVDYELQMDDFTEHGHRYYMTLMRGNLQLRQGDTVYVLRDIPIPGTDKKHTYETIGKIDYSELDIFRIERLWKDKDTGKRFAYGHHYLRPHETFHEPTRKFFPNEVMRVPLYEAVPVELIMEHCWVMDINTFCKGRPVGCQEQHIYICEYRVDKAAKMFSKTSKSKFPICTKSFAFERFETRLKVSRTYCPHDVDAALLKNNLGRGKKDEKEKDKQK